MKHLLILSPILLVACVQHQDPCVVHRPPCNPLVEDCACNDYSGQDSDRASLNPSVPDVDDGDNGSDSDGSGDDNGGPTVDDHGPSDDTNGYKTSDKNEDRPREDHNGGDSGSSDKNGGKS